jgi:DoxX-like protein
MDSATPAAPISKAALWTGRILSAIPVLLLLTSAIAKFMKPPNVVEGFAKFGYSESIIVKLAIIELVFTAIYLIPRAAVFGAILLTAFLGGATATHARVSDPAVVGPVLCGVLLWLGLYLRDARLRALVPLRS